MKRVPSNYTAAKASAPRYTRSFDHAAAGSYTRQFSPRRKPVYARLGAWLGTSSHAAISVATRASGNLRSMAASAFARLRMPEPAPMRYVGPRRHLRAAAFWTNVLYGGVSAAALAIALTIPTPDIKTPTPPLADVSQTRVLSGNDILAAIPAPDLTAPTLPAELKAKPQNMLGTTEMFVPKVAAPAQDALPTPPAARPAATDGTLRAAFAKVSAQTKISTGPAPKTLIGGEDVGLDVWKRHTEKPHLVAYSGDQPAGSILVDFTKRDLYFVVGDGRAVAYKIASPKPGMEPPARHYNVKGSTLWPSWTPTASVLKSAPDLKEALAARRQTSIEGGQHNPMGSAALYLRNDKGVDEGFRIHGTNDPETIGEGASIGCIRLHNLDLTAAPDGFIDHQFPLYKLAQQVKGSISVTIYRDGEAVPGIGENPPAGKIAATTTTPPLQESARPVAKPEKPDPAEEKLRRKKVSQGIAAECEIASNNKADCREFASHIGNGQTIELQVRQKDGSTKKLRVVFENSAKMATSHFASIIIKQQPWRFANRQAAAQP